MRATDPARLTEAERFAEIVAILARGYVRLLSASGHDKEAGQISQDCLAAEAPIEAAWDSPTQKSKSEEHAA